MNQNVSDLNDKKVIVKYSLFDKDWIENNIYSFLFEESKCVHITDLNPNWEELRRELISFNGLEIFGIFKGYSNDNKSIWIFDLLQLKRDLILNKILP